MDCRVCGYWGSILCRVELFTYAYLFNDTFLFFLDQHGVLPQDNSTLGTPSEMGGSYPNSSGSASMDTDMLNAIITGNAAPFSNSSVKNLIVQSVEQAMSFLSERYPSGNYTWGKFYGFFFINLFGLNEFNVGPVSKGGDFNTPNDASGVESK